MKNQVFHRNGHTILLSQSKDELNTDFYQRVTYILNRFTSTPYITKYITTKEEFDKLVNLSFINLQKQQLSVKYSEETENLL